MTRVIYGPRHSGRTTKLIDLCKQMNRIYGSNYAVILVRSISEAAQIMQMAVERGYKDMPYPVTLTEVQQLTGRSHYKTLLIDNLDLLIQDMLGPRFAVAGYTINSEDFLDEISKEAPEGKDG